MSTILLEWLYHKIPFLTIFPEVDILKIEFLFIPAAPNDFSSSLTDGSSVLNTSLWLFKTICFIWSICYF